jgi:hypothetical protein
MSVLQAMSLAGIRETAKTITKMCRASAGKWHSFTAFLDECCSEATSSQYGSYLM